MRIGVLLLLICKLSLAQTGVKILFDAKKAESAGNADWVLDADQYNIMWNPNATIAGSTNESNAQRFPTPSQSLITASTAETFWSGAISYWGIDCVKKGYQVESLPYNAQITYGNSGNPQDLSNYKVYIVDEPNIMFTASEKTAIMQFIQNGGSLFMISDHTISDRNGDGFDSPDIWNDLITNNGVANNSFGFKFDLANISQTSSNVISAPTDSILHGPAGNVTQVMWANGTTMSLTPSQNSTVKGVIYTTGSPQSNSNVMCAYARIGNGKVAAIGDSSPTDDGTGDPNDNPFYNGYITDAAGNHQRLLMNITIWLARGGSPVTGIKESNKLQFSLYPNPFTSKLNVSNYGSLENMEMNIIDALGKIVYSEKINSQEIDLSSLSDGIYVIRINDKDGISYTQKIIKQTN